MGTTSSVLDDEEEGSSSMSQAGEQEAASTPRRRGSCQRGLLRADGSPAEPLTASLLLTLMEEVSEGTEPFDRRRLVFMRKLQTAKRNHGDVNLMQHRGDHKRLVAVKKMPRNWICDGAQEFNEQYPQASEKPWVDLGILRHLNDCGCRFVCELLGVFTDHSATYVVTSYATDGDMFSWCCDNPADASGESSSQPIVRQIFAGVRFLHDAGIAHRDLSLENILLTSDEDGGETRVKLIDFGMATLSRYVTREVRGKASYQAPEMHLAVPCDTFLVDSFALGVVLFTVGATDYPWHGTRRGSCELYEYAHMFGLRKFLERRKWRNGDGQHLSQILTPSFVDLLEGLLQIDPLKRWTLGEGGFVNPEGRTSAWESKWLAAEQSTDGVANLPLEGEAGTMAGA